ncbi:MaoC/PaaZ C-terminal domain-containing protein [Caballeronia sp. LZ001]|uniref:MaoC/PaaZ C-terminal domain-containing protein n=1 Tax=Caballeronia sp. LZ001 TaxID=3038553 RepID=UPI0028544F0D|nr:MaoC/PaaZ C-terminal domain-containing protein [Caballeronia sp. LZ001]MDR5804877.1 MaoC/PaaZ C-terminal domain-containing protein [Caballeronia sp. LZ001]
MLNYEAVKNYEFPEVTQSYTERDTILYALGIGFGDDPVHPGHLRHVVEGELRTVPSMATVLAKPDRWATDPRTGIDFVKLVHGEQEIVMHRPIPAAGTLRARSQIGAICDKGAGKGAVVEVSRELRDTDGVLYANVRQTVFLRGDGGYSQHGGTSDEPPAPLPAAPTAPPDLEVDLATLEQSALIYRLSGDLNPLHSNPETARKAGFPRPILHGLCTYGMAARAAMQVLCEYDGARIRRLAARFSSPVFPGETIRFRLWRHTDGTFQLDASVPERNTTVLSHGVIELA